MGFRPPHQAGWQNYIIPQARRDFGHPLTPERLRSSPDSKYIGSTPLDGRRLKPGAAHDKSLMNQTINDIFFSVVERNLDQAMLYKQTVKWIPISSRELYRDVVGTARSLAKWGIAKGDRVAILSENRPEWQVADFATMLLGAVDVPIYPTLTQEQTAELLKDSGARVIFVSTVDHLKKVLAIKSQTALEKVVVMDYVGIPEGIPMHRMMMPDAGVARPALSKAEGAPSPADWRDPEMDARAKSISPDDLATIIYTSGTTGEPKGVMLTHGNLLSNLAYSLEVFDLKVGQRGISFLPLSHVTARHADYALLQYGVTIAYCPQLPNAGALFDRGSPDDLCRRTPRLREDSRHRAASSPQGLRRRSVRVGDARGPRSSR